MFSKNICYKLMRVCLNPNLTILVSSMSQIDGKLLLFGANCTLENKFE